MLANKQQKIGALLIVAAIGGLLAFFYLEQQSTYPKSDEIHVHADWLVVINGQILDLTADRYQSSAENIKHSDFHMHDNEDHVLHRHGEGVTLGSFLDSIGFSITNTCLTTDLGDTYCENTENALALYVNGKRHLSPPNYIIQEEDQLLLYYGERNQITVDTFLDQITDESCIYSGTCPERGVAPPESCGLTCEL